MMLKWKVTLELWKELWSGHEQFEGFKTVTVSASTKEAAIEKAKSKVIKPIKVDPVSKWSPFMFARNVQSVSIPDEEPPPKAPPNLTIKLFLVPHGYQIDFFDENGKQIGDACRSFAGDYPEDKMRNVVVAAFADAMKKVEAVYKKVYPKKKPRKIPKAGRKMSFEEAKESTFTKYADTFKRLAKK